MPDQVDTLLWPWGLLPYNRACVAEFDIGAITLPFERRFVPIPNKFKRWFYGWGGVGGCVAGVWLIRQVMHNAEGFWDHLFGWGIGLVFVGAGVFGLPSLFFGGRKQMTVRIDPDWVEIDDRPPLDSRQHWREPLANYTAVRCHTFALTWEGAPGSWTPPMDCEIWAIDLDHPDADRVIPLLRTMKTENVERRWQDFAAVLGKSMTGEAPAEKAEAETQC